MDERDRREVDMLKLLAKMVDGFNAQNFYFAHKNVVEEGKCSPCARATVKAYISNFDTDESLTEFEGTLCDEMRKALKQIIEAEVIARSVGKAVNQATANISRAN